LKLVNFRENVMGKAVTTNYLLLGVVFGWIAILPVARVVAGSAVAVGDYGEHAVVVGPNYSKKEAEQKALALWHSKWSGSAKILVSSDVVGDGAVAVWNNGEHWAIGAVVGKSSRSEAERLAILNCLTRCPAGVKPKIIRTFKG
jgi:hypothetical protein